MVGRVGTVGTGVKGVPLILRVFNEVSYYYFDYLGSSRACTYGNDINIDFETIKLLLLEKEFFNNLKILKKKSIKIFLLYFLRKYLIT